MSGSEGSEQACSAASSPARSVASVDSEDLQSLLRELNLIPAAVDNQQVPPATNNKRQRRFVVDSDSDAASSPTVARPQSSPRVEESSSSGTASSSEGQAATAAAIASSAPGGGSHARRPLLQPSSSKAMPRQQQQRQDVSAAEPEVIEILDSSESESEEEWRIAAPSTVQKRQVVDSDNESESESDVEEVENEPASSQRTALPPYFAAIPSLAAPAPTKAQPKQPQPPRRQPQQQQTAPAAKPSSSSSTTTSSSSGSPKASAAGTAAPPPSSRPLSASAFKKQREELTRQLFQQYNASIFEGQLPADLEIKWNSRLLTTAGLTHYRRDIPADPYAPPIYSARVELSSKVLDCYSKLERTLCHELCHVAAWLVNHTAKPPHGPVFKAWADRAMFIYRHLDITTCHQYEIFYAFRWQCSNTACLQTYGRHSNSIDITKKVCGACRAPLTFLGKFKPDGTPAKQRGPSKYAQFVKEHHAEVKASLPAGTPQAVIMQHLSAKYAQLNGGGSGGGQATDDTQATTSLLHSLNLQA